LDGTATATVNGGTAPYSYIWNDSNSQPADMAVYLNSGWYTVIITDANGCEISDSVFVDSELGLEANEESNLFIFPNPAKDVLNISEPIEKVEIFDIIGKIVYETKLVTDTISISNLSPGKYTIRLHKSGNISKHYFVKN
jgi:hypothetical protein